MTKDTTTTAADKMARVLEAEQKMRANLTAVKSVRRYNNPERVFPGAVFEYQGRRYVMSGQLTNGKYLWAEGISKKNFPARDCRILISKA